MERQTRKKTKKEEAEDNPEQGFPSIPEEVILNIFPSLPFNSISRFRCVSKTWFSLISESKSQRQRALIMSLVGTQFSFHFIDQKTQVNTLEESWVTLFPNRYESVKLLGSCNGLLLIAVDCDLFLWNPAIKYCKKVLSYEKLGKPRYWVKSGLCFDPIKDDYKVLMGFLGAPKSRSSNGFFVLGSFKNKTWTEVQFPYRFELVKPGPVLRNRLHWSVSRKEDDLERELNKIFYFDPMNDEFVDLPMPEPKKDVGNVLIGVGVLDECISIAMWEKLSDYDGNVEILVMKDYGVKESWETLFRIEHVGFCDQVVPLFYIDGEKSKVLMKVSKKNEDYMVAYSVNEDSWTNIEIVNHNYYAIWYEESCIEPTEYGYGVGGDVYIEKLISSVNPLRTTRKSNGSWETTELPLSDR